MRWRICFAAIFCVSCLIVSRADAQNAPPTPAPLAAETAATGVIGTIIEIEGGVTVTPPDGQAGAAAVNTPLRLNDTVKTGPGGRAFILFIDNTEMTLSENTKVTIDDYVFDPDNDKDNKARYSVLEGAFQYVSGLIGHKADPDVKIETPVGSIGIRGTDFWAGNLDGQYGVAVNEGQVALKTDQGSEAVVNKGEGTSVLDRYHAPARAQALPRERLQRIAATVHLQRRAEVVRRVGAMQERQKLLRGRFKEYMLAHRRQGRWEGLRAPYRGQAAGGEDHGLAGHRTGRIEERRRCLEAAGTREERRACHLQKDR